MRKWSPDKGHRLWFRDLLDFGFRVQCWCGWRHPDTFRTIREAREAGDEHHLLGGMNDISSPRIDAQER